MAIGIGVAVLVIAAAVIFIGTRPDTFRIERSALIGAPAAAVFPMINDFHQWNRWSPWEKVDPNMQRTFEGASAGLGAVYSWSGNSKAGSGRITMTESKPDRLVAIKLEFFKPFAATRQGRFLLVPSAGGTQVTWSMEGKNNLMGKVMAPFMDGMVGKEFEKGLANLNVATKIAEKTSRQSA
jgi:hypothetical protein